MYLKIEEEFKKKSSLRLSQLAFFGTYYLLAVPFACFCIKYVSEKLWLWILLYASVFYIGAYIYIIIKVREFKGFSWKKVFDIDININLYKIQVHDNDIKLLKKILEKHNINTSSKQVEAIRHYQALIPRNIVGGSSFIAVLAFSISVIALLLDDKMYYSEENVQFVFSVLFVISLIYLIFHILNKSVFKLFGSVELYKRLETSISEIYMDDENQLKGAEKD